MALETASPFSSAIAFQINANNMRQANFEENEFSTNPYQPHNQPTHSKKVPPLDFVEHSVVLRSLANWQTFFAAIGFLFTGLILIFGLLSVVQVFRQGTSALGELVFGVMFLLMAIFFYLLLSLLLLRAALTARVTVDIGSEELSQFILAQRTFWRYCGVLSIIVFVLYLGGFVLLLLFGFGLSGISV